ncbi:MAG TPA: hypothetical protein VFA12_20320 [Stellaceae bacterium]|nr:hypothetical protein [Stellaceae bacterium]
MTGEQPDMDITVTVNSEDGGTQVYDTTASALAAEQRELGNTGLADPRHIIGEIILGGGFGGFHWRRIGGEENLPIVLSEPVYVTRATLTTAEKSSWRIEEFNGEPNGPVLVIGYRDETTAIAALDGSDKARRARSAIESLPAYLDAAEALGNLLRHPALQGDEDPAVDRARMAYAAAMTRGAAK